MHTEGRAHSEGDHQNEGRSPVGVLVYRRAHTAHLPTRMSRRNPMKRQRRLAGLVVSLVLCWAAAARADVVTDWNAISIPIIGTPARGGGSAFLDFAMVHLAIHDAIQAYEGRFESYGTPIANADGSPIAAAASAAHDVLVNRFPAQAASLDTTLQGYLTNLGLVGDPGVAIGQEAAAPIISPRTGDGSWPSNPEVFTGGTQPGEWRPTPPALAPMAVPWLGDVVPFALKDASQLFPSPPPTAVSSDEYTQDYNEVKALGRATNSSRTPEQTALALFYSDNLIVLGQRELRGVAATLDDIGVSARLLALADVSAADAVIGAWRAKRIYNFWRPITAIQEGDNDGNPDTAGDPTWLPLAVTPAYPDYTSGANSVFGAFTRTLALMFGDKTTFIVTSTPVNQTKAYERFSDQAADMVEVRMLQGIHFRTADEVGRRMGRRSANWAFSHILRPLHGPNSRSANH